MATKSAIDGPAGPVVAGDHLRRDSSLDRTYNLANVLNYTWMYRLIILSLYPCVIGVH